MSFRIRIAISPEPFLLYDLILDFVVPLLSFLQPRQPGSYPWLARFILLVVTGPGCYNKRNLTGCFITKKGYCEQRETITRTDSSVADAPQTNRGDLVVTPLGVTAGCTFLLVASNRSGNI